MLTRVDRIQITTRDRAACLEPWRELLGATVVREDSVAELGAERTVLRLGASEVELLEPHRLGAVAEHVSRTRGGIFAAGLAARDLDAVRARLEAQGIHQVGDEEQIFVSADWLGIPGLRLVISKERPGSEPGARVRSLYEVTHLSHDYEAAAKRFAERFGLDPSHFVPIRSEQYGYEGILTLLDPERLDRIETVTPFDLGKTMGRFFTKRGPCFYMAYVESDEPEAIRERLLARAPRDWTGPPEGEPADNLFIHPNALGGVLLGVSRTGLAWRWSGHPERAQAASAA